MNYLPLRIWFIVSITLALGAVLVRLVWEVTSAPATATLVLMILVILATLGIYALLLYLVIKPSLKKLKSRLVRISATVILTAAIIGSIIHYVRFVPSPEAISPLSVVIASMLLAAGISAYPLALWVIWFIRKA